MIPSVSCEIKETLFDISATRVFFDGFDNIALAKQVLEAHRRLSDDPNSCLFEDTIFNPADGSVGYDFLLTLKKYFLDKGYSIAEFWSQIHRPLESTSTHHHGKYDMAFVYYVKVPKGAGDIVFEVEDINRALTPQEGTMLIFPGWLKHKVSKNMGNDIRISIAGNLRCLDESETT